MNFSNDVSSEFPYEEPSERLLEAIAEVEEMKKQPERYKTYTSVEELFRDLDAEGSDD